MRVGMESLPFAGSYWVEPGRLLAGVYPGGVSPEATLENLGRLVDCGIRRIISLIEDHEMEYLGKRFATYERELSRIALETGIELSRASFPIEDMGAPSPRLMCLILDEIDAAIAMGRPVYLHCWGGRGRTGTVVGCYLVRHGLTGGQALDRIKILRRAGNVTDHHLSPETRVQREFVNTWKMWEQART